MTLRRDHFEQLLEILKYRRTVLATAEAGLRARLALQPTDSETASRGGGTNPRTTIGEAMMEQQKECPECGHKFRGNGWDGSMLTGEASMKGSCRTWRHGR
jgi:hypothetical protein